MKTYIIRFSVSGIKNINEMVSIDFYNNSIAKNKVININKRNIKAIYGVNGAGKSAYITGVDIYKSLVLKDNYLVQDNIINKLNTLINKNTKELILENIFCSTDDNNKIKNILKHTLIVKPIKDELDQIKYILKEKLEKLIGNTINSEYIEIYSFTNDKLNISESGFKDSLYIQSNYAKKLGDSTLASYTLNILLNEIKEKMNRKKSLLEYLIDVYMNAFNTRVYLDTSDIHEEYLLADDNLDLKDLTSYTVKTLTNTFIIVKKEEDIVNKNCYDIYVNQVENYAKFLKILKPDLKTIRIEKRIENDVYHCKKIYVYDNYEIDEEYESSGIKRISKLYNYISQAVKGQKVFIDELDANISGVFLDKLIEFIEENGKGQLIFTSHNVMSMNTLKKYSNSISTIGETLKVVNVVKNGHYSPVNLYYEGYIEDCPHNINSYDFFKTFKVN